MFASVVRRAKSWLGRDRLLANHATALAELSAAETRRDSRRIRAARDRAKAALNARLEARV